MLYIESPTGVGFSYGDEASGDYYSGDMSTAKDNFRLLQKFYERFPGLADNDLYLTGESYAGHCKSHPCRPVVFKSSRSRR